VSPANHDVIQYLLRIKVESLRYAFDPFWSEGVLCVDEHHLALTASL
jgi:hypothetical protein